MSGPEKNLEDLIRRLDIDTEPDPAHRARLRWQMLSRFNETAQRQSSRQTIWRNAMKSPLTKLAVAAAILIVAIITVRHFKAEPTVERTEGLPEAISTPRHDPNSDLVPIEIELPNPIEVGTLKDNRVPNLEKPSDKPRPPFLAPVGTKNVARGKPVSSSDEEPIIGEIEMITDGDKEATDGSFVELGPFAQNVTIDLEAIHNIYAIVVWHFHQEPRVYFDVVVQVADDRDFIEHVRTVFNNDIDNSAGLGVGRDKHYIEHYTGKLIDAKGIKGRYVRLHSRGNNHNDMNHYIEVEVYGQPAK